MMCDVEMCDVYAFFCLTDEVITSCFLCFFDKKPGLD